MVFYIGAVVKPYFAPYFALCGARCGRYHSRNAVRIHGELAAPNALARMDRPATLSVRHRLDNARRAPLALPVETSGSTLNRRKRRSVYRSRSTCPYSRLLGEVIETPETWSRRQIPDYPPTSRLPFTDAQKSRCRRLRLITSLPDVIRIPVVE